MSIHLGRLKIQNISNIDKYEINLIEFLNIWTNVVVAYKFENSEDVLSKAFCHYILLFFSTSNELVDIPSKSLKNREYVTYVRFNYGVTCFDF